jgi:hypothetical protein
MQKEKTKRKLKITQKEAIKYRILIICSLATAPEKGAW